MVVSCVVAKVSAAAQEPGLAQFLDAPYLSSLVGAAKADRFVWIQQHQGRRNLWLADGPDYRARPITHFENDDGQEISNVAISDDGQVVSFARGGAANKEGFSPNPA